MVTIYIWSPYADQCAWIVTIVVPYDNWHSQTWSLYTYGRCMQMVTLCRLIGVYRDYSASLWKMSLSNMVTIYVWSPYADRCAYIVTTALTYENSHSQLWLLHTFSHGTHIVTVHGKFFFFCLWEFSPSIYCVQWLHVCGD